MKNVQKNHNIQKTLAIYLIILIQCTLAIIAGMAAVYLFTGNSLPNGIKVDKVDIGGVDRTAAAGLINKHYIGFFSHEKLKISVNDEKEYNIPYSDFEVKIDAEATINSILGIRSLEIALKKSFSPQKIDVTPVVNFNESKLRKILADIAAEIDKKPVDAALSYGDGKIIKIPEQDGQKLDIEKTMGLIRKHISSDASGILALSRYNNSGLETLHPQRKLRDLDEVDTILSEFSTKLIYTEFSDAIKKSSNAINGAVIPSVNNGNNSSDSAFSLVKWLEKSNFGFDNDNEGYDQVASTLYAALLSTGIDKNSIIRSPHQTPVDYIEPGLDACISNKGDELKFTNTLSHMVAIFAYIEDDRIVIKIGGNTQDKKTDTDLKVNLTGRFPPPVYEIKDDSLKAGEKIVVDPGSDGIAVQVYRGKELISEDKYEGLTKVVQAGTGPNPSDNDESK